MAADEACDKIPSRYNWDFSKNAKDKYPSKDDIIKLYIGQILIRTQKMFEYSGLPETIPQKDLEFILQRNGFACFAKVKDELYAFRCGLGGKPNVYYLPTLAIVANPALNYTAELEIDKDCVVVLNDPLYQGIMPLVRHNSILLAECDVSFKFAAINSRIPIIGIAKDDNTKDSFNEFYNKVINGDDLSIVVDDNFLDGETETFKAYNFGQANDLIKNLIELKQYIKGSFLQDLGINSQFNMKREAINEAEAALSDDILFPTIDEMLEQRKLGIERVNKMFGTNITVELSSVWKAVRKEAKISEDKAEAEVKEIEAAADNTSSEEVSNEGKDS